MSTLQEEFEQAARVSRSGTNPPDAQRQAALDRLKDLYRQATEGAPEGREDAMRQYIELVGDLGQQDA